MIPTPAIEVIVSFFSAAISTRALLFLGFFFFPPGFVPGVLYHLPLFPAYVLQSEVPSGRLCPLQFPAVGVIDP